MGDISSIDECIVNQPSITTDVVIKTAPATLCQQSQWYEQRLFPPAYWPHWNVSYIWYPSEGVQRNRAIEAISNLVNRHEGLRTTLHEGRLGVLTQRIHKYRQPDVFEVASGSSEESYLIDRLNSAGFDLERDYPIRFGIVTSDDRSVRAIHCVGNHIVIDNWTLRILKFEFQHLLSDGAAASDGNRAQDIWQPSDIANIECSPEGAGRSARAISYWKRQLQESPSSLLPGLDTDITARMADWRERHLMGVMLESPSLYKAATILADSTGMSVQAFMLSSYVALLARYFGLDSIPLKVMVSNRFDRRTHDTITCLAQPVLVNCRVAQDRSLLGLARDCYSTLLKSYRHGSYNSEKIDQLVIEESREREVPVYIERLFDVVWGGTDEATTDHPVDVSELDIGSSEMEIVGECVDRGPEQSLRVRGYNGRCRVTLWADSECIPEPDMRRLLFGIESIVVGAYLDNAIDDSEWLSERIMNFPSRLSLSGNSE
ncbi:condensation domain-containing protein [Nocardia sp. NBC_01499]|uniref:condensation domain-containing protein n=1 Tax=Nocardia sp. NBC_01499 TaxID=2903597 RepID=UPI003862E197